ncbi:MAG: hypothetical protein RI947_1211 [Candidatus Parcubacteria bacterium]|jgi:hypothetical protein
MNTLISALFSIAVLSTLLSVLSHFNWQVEAFVATIVGAVANIIWVIMGVFLALSLDSVRKPQFELSVDESMHTDVRYQNGQRWKFYRIKVVNKSIPHWLRWIFPFTTRETAEQVQGVVVFKQLGRTMKGRWAYASELQYPNKTDYIHMSNFPEPVTIAAGQAEPLDLLVKYEHDSEAYGWNNESYLHDWKVPQYRLMTGDWEVYVQVTALNGIAYGRSFMVHIAPSIESTYITAMN